MFLFLSCFNRKRIILHLFSNFLLISIFLHHGVFNACNSSYKNSNLHKHCLFAWIYKMSLHRSFRPVHQTIDKKYKILWNKEKIKWEKSCGAWSQSWSCSKNKIFLFAVIGKIPIQENREFFLKFQNFLQNTVQSLPNKHIYGTKLSKKGKTTYPLRIIENELIELLSKEGKRSHSGGNKTANYFLILFDSTPDVFHIDQMTFIVSYVKIDNNNEVKIKSFFLNSSFHIHGKNGDKFSKSCRNRLQQKGLDIMTCWGQAYDNASTTAGVRSGVQRRIKDSDLMALFIPSGKTPSLYLARVYLYAQVLQ